VGFVVLAADRLGIRMRGRLARRLAAARQ
jgi:hypothetical protein